MPWGSVDLLHGWFPYVLAAGAAGSLALSFGRRTRRWRRRDVPLILAVATLATVVVCLVVHAAGAIPYTYPPSFQVWAGAVVLAVVVAVAGWPSARWWRRATSLVAVILVAAWAANTINRFYAYYPTLGDVFDARLHNEVSPAELAALVPPPARPTGPDASRQPEPGPRDPGQPQPAPPAPGQPAATFPEPAVSPSTPPPSPTTAATAPPDGPTPTSAPTEGELVEVAIPPTVSGFQHRGEYVYLPPAWFATPRPRLPAVEMLAGVPGEPADWIRGGLATQTADRYAATHAGMTPILVFADANGAFTRDTECVDGPRGRVETYLTQDVPTYIQATFNAALDPERWGVAGLSEGGTCAVTLALRHPDVFRSAVDLSGDLRPNLGDQATTVRDLYGGDASQWADHDPCTLLSRRRFPGSSLWLEAGSHDVSKQAAVRQIASAATAAGMDVQLVIKRGRHNFEFWAEGFGDAFPWLAGKLGVS